MKSPGLGRCGNPNCRRKNQPLTGIDIDGLGSFWMCHTCYAYTHEHNTLRSRDMVKGVKKLQRRRRNRRKHTHCHNENCRTRLLEHGEYGLQDGKFYCRACARYVNSHNGEQRPESLVKKYVCESKTCGNPSCGALVSYLYSVDVDGAGKMALCQVCHQYARRNGRLRSRELVEKYAKMVENAGESEWVDAEEELTDFEDGEEASSSDLDVPLECGNPSCQRECGVLESISVEDTPYELCHTCYDYARRTGRLRTMGMEQHVQKWNVLRQPKGKVCFNPNCRTTELANGVFGEKNGEFYCELCGQYANRHGGDERPKAVIEAYFRSLRDCGGCGKKTKYVKAATVGAKSLQLCRKCFKYFSEHKTLPGKSPEKEERRCANEFCRSSELVYGGLYKPNGQFYCRQCFRYIKAHGVERPQRMVESTKKRRLRNMLREAMDEA